MGICWKTTLRALLNGSLWMLWMSWPQLGVPQAAGSDQNRPGQLVVKYADLDLSRHAGVVELYRRIEKAARAVCTSRFASAEQPVGPDACFVDAVARAVAEINHPALSRYFTARMEPERAVDSRKPP